MTERRPNLNFDVVPSLPGMEAFFGIGEVANRTLEGGWELLFRNRLLRLLHERASGQFPAVRIDRECVVVPGKRKKDGAPGEKSRIADIAFLPNAPVGRGDCPNPLAVVEIKHNFATQSEALRSVFKDVEKWSDWKRSGAGRKCELHFIQMITDVKRLASPVGDEVEKGGLNRAPTPKFSQDVCKDFFKYSIQPDEKRREERISAIRKRLEEVQDLVDKDIELYARNYSVSSSRYFDDPIDYRADIHVFLVSQRASVCLAPDRPTFSKPKDQKGLIHFAKT